MNDMQALFVPVPVILGVSAMPFLFALYHVLKLVLACKKGKTASLAAVKALKNIRYGAIVIAMLFVLGIPFFIQLADADDAPGAVGIPLIAIVLSIVTAVVAGVLQKRFKNANT